MSAGFDFEEDRVRGCIVSEGGVVVVTESISHRSRRRGTSEVDAARLSL